MFDVESTERCYGKINIFLIFPGEQVLTWCSHIFGAMHQCF